ncbi:MAG: UDP-N-acetylglucosamine 1-carboxyvinyltransferase [Bacilli bacterium]
MKALNIQGGKELKGTIRISGAKNSSVALIPAAILADDVVTICNVPEITDIDALSDILEYLNADVKRASESIVIDPKTSINRPIPTNMAQKLRASYYFMGALLGKYKHVEMSFPGGCSIGARPINLHLKGFEALGAKITQNDNVYIVDAEELKGANIYLDIASVGATINIMLAAVKAKGTTIIDNAAKEPEIVNVATFLNNMGARITGAGTSEIRIKGVEKLNGCFHEVIPDRIEAGTYMIIAALTGNNVKIDNIIPEHLEALTSKLAEIGVPIEMGLDYAIIKKPKNYKPVNIKTLVFPGFPTDLQQPFSVLLTQCNGKSTVEETIYENRFMHVPELEKMGANIKVNGTKAVVYGPTKLSGSTVTATDLRAGAAMICAALITESDEETIITNAEHILRGYENIVEKLRDIGAKIRIIEI